MKKCSFAVEAFLGIPIDYENWFEHIIVELTDEQFTLYYETLKHWETTDEWKNWDSANGDNFFIKRDLPEIYTLIWEQLIKEAPKIWDERVINYLDQINIYTADEIWHAAQIENKEY